MAETAQVYIDSCAPQADAEARPGTEILIEQRFSLAKINPPFDAGGTGDAVILDRVNKTIEIVDLKGGRGVVVEAVGNKQLRTYALGAVLANPGDWRTVRVTIVQPRAPHPDGRIRSEEPDVIDLFDWTVDPQEAMANANGAVWAYKKVTHDGTMTRRSGLNFTFRRMDHRLFCKAKAMSGFAEDSAGRGPHLLQARRRHGATPAPRP